MIELIQGDCLEVMKDISDQSVDLVLADLPYGITASSWDNKIDIDRLWQQYRRIIKQTGAVLLFANHKTYIDFVLPATDIYRYSWYWVKNQGTNFFHAKRMPIRKIEHILVFYNKQPIYNPQMSTGHIPTNSGKGSSPGRVYHGTNKRDYKGGETSRFPVDILKFKCVDNYSRIHPNQKPVDLCTYFVKTYTNNSDVVLDNVMGVGTTGIACLNTGRNFIGIELDEKYFNVAKQRIENHTVPLGI